MARCTIAWTRMWEAAMGVAGRATRGSFIIQGGKLPGAHAHPRHRLGRPIVPWDRGIAGLGNPCPSIFLRHSARRAGRRARKWRPFHSPSTKHGGNAQLPFSRHMTALRIIKDAQKATATCKLCSGACHRERTITLVSVTCRSRERLMICRRAAKVAAEVRTEDLSLATDVRGGAASRG